VDVLFPAFCTTNIPQRSFVPNASIPFLSFERFSSKIPVKNL